MYDYGARFYQPDLGRFTTIDPLASSYQSWSPYHYAANDPIRMVDVGGMGWGDGLIQFVQEAASATIEFGAGVGNALASNNLSISSLDGSQSIGYQRESGGSAFTAGQVVGDAISLVQGAAEVAGGVITAAAGGTVEVVSLGGATPVAVPAIAAGAAVTTHGANVLRNAKNNLLKSEGDSKGTNKDVSTKTDRQKSQTQLERSQNQLEGLEKAQQAAKKQAKGEKQNKIQSTKKSEQRLKNDLKNIDNLDDLDY